MFYGDNCAAVHAGQSSFDVQLPATFEVLSVAINTSLVGNVAAGSHRLVSCAGSGHCMH